jgi:tRNA pseudouridine13 synthase
MSVSPSSRPSLQFKVEPEDFVVDEIAAFEPSGVGDHLYIHLRKTNRATEEVLRAIARALGVDARDASAAGLKDVRSVATQWISVPLPAHARGVEVEEKAKALAIDGIEILATRRHNHKLRTGLLQGNRFTVRLKGARAGDEATIDAELKRLSEGIPNAYGVQRFRQDGSNVARARSWLCEGGPAPRDKRQRRFEFSVLQSEGFNRFLQARVEAGTWRTPLLGDWLEKTATGGVFRCDDPAVDGPRAQAGEVVVTGPMFGSKMRRGEHAVGELERAICADVFGADFDFGRASSLGEGTRRSLVLQPESLTWTWEQRPGASPGVLSVSFVLPKGAYATTVLGAVFDLIETKGNPSASVQRAPDETDREQDESSETSP